MAELIRLGSLVAMLLVAGCSHVVDSLPLMKVAKELPRVPTPRNAIRFEAVFVERPIGDPLLGDELWQNVDQVGAISPQARTALRDAGFRVGHAGSTPPMALQSLMGYRSNGDDAAAQGDGRSIQQFTLQSGAETEIQVNPRLYPHCLLTRDAGINGQAKNYQNVRCVLRMKAERLQDGWVRLRFTPEIHHGEQRLRFAVIGTELGRRTQQESERFYEQAFSIDLTLGELAVISANETSRNCVGTLFFVGTEETDTQRLLVIRLADMRRVDPVYAE